MLSAARNVVRRAGRQVAHPVAAGAIIHRGALVVLDATFAKPGFEGAGLTSAGLADATADNAAGSDGAVFVTVSRDDWFRLRNADADPVGRVHINQPCFVVDDETVAASDGGGTRSPAGIVRDVDDAGVWVEF